MSLLVTCYDKRMLPLSLPHLRLAHHSGISVIVSLLWEPHWGKLRYTKLLVVGNAEYSQSTVLASLDFPVYRNIFVWLMQEKYPRFPFTEKNEPKLYASKLCSLLIIDLNLALVFIGVDMGFLFSSVYNNHIYFCLNVSDTLWNHNERYLS